MKAKIEYVWEGNIGDMRKISEKLLKHIVSDTKLKYIILQLGGKKEPGTHCLVLGKTKVWLRIWVE